MSAIRVTITAYAPSTVSDDLGIEALAEGAAWTSSPGVPGASTTFVVTGATWTRLRPRLLEMSQRRIPAYNPTTGAAIPGKTMPALVYTADWVPSGRPAIHSIEGAPLSLASPANLTLRGVGFLGSTFAYAVIQQAVGGYSSGFPGTRTVPRTVEVFRVTSVLPGPIGNQMTLIIAPASGAGSVVTTPNPDAGGGLLVRVTPAAGASTTTAIAAQINGDAVASTFMSATATVAGVTLSPTLVAPIFGPGGGGGPGTTTAALAVLRDGLRLRNGDGSSPSYLNVRVVESSYANRLRIVSNRAGNDQNLITLTINMSQGANTVAVSGNDITVNRTGATETIANLVTAINGNASAAALVTASAVGSGSLGALSKTWFSGGAGEPVVVTVGGAVARVVSQTDTAMVIATTNANLVAAGVTVGEIVAVQLSMHYGRVSMTVGAVAA